jgi:hypothetical protein
MSTEPSKRFRSTYHDIDLQLLKQLCDLHPWSRAQLCKAVDMEPAVLSMVLAGKRPLPTRVARQFLDLMGMTEDGSLDRSHLFIFSVRSGQEDDLLLILGKIFFPDSKVKSILNCQIKAHVPNADPSNPPSLRTGYALFNGSSMAVVHAAIDSKVGGWWNPGQGVVTRQVANPEVLLSTEVLPTRSDLIKAVHGSNALLNPTWAEVIEEAKRRNVESHEVMLWLKEHFSAVPHAKPDGLQ